MSQYDSVFWNAVLSGNVGVVRDCLEIDKSLAGKDHEPESQATSSFALFHASQQGNLEMVQLLLQSGADPDAKKADVDGNPREIGMPLIHAINADDFPMIQTLLDAGATVKAYPNCDVPFVSRVYNKALAAGAPKKMVLKGFADAEPEKLKHVPEVSDDAPEVIKVWDRVLSLGGAPNHYAIAIAQDYETIEWLLRSRPNDESIDHWGANVHEALLYGSAWHGDARTVKMCMEICADRHTTYAAAHCIGNAIRSHNRKGKFEDYRQTIEMNLRFLKERDALYEHEFLLPYHWLACKFISDFYYGPLGEEPTIEHQLILARLFHGHGFDVNHNVADSDSALTLAIADAHLEFANFLRDKGANEPDAQKLQAVKECVFWKRLTKGHPERVKRMLRADPSLALKNYEPESLHTDGFPLYHATKLGDFEMIEMILEAGADPDAKLETDDPRESGMPLMNAFHHANANTLGHYDNVHLILRYNPSLNAYPYCATPFVDCLFNNMWDANKNYSPGERWAYKNNTDLEVATLFRNSFSNYLSGDSDSKGTQIADRSGEQIPEMELLRTVVESGGQPSLFTLVRHQQHDLIDELLESSPSEPGTEMDWPHGTLFGNIVNGASWCGYPQTILACMRICPELYSSDLAKHVIERAIRSHNRDGGIDQYFVLIESQLAFLKSNDAISEEPEQARKQKQDNGDVFLPLHWLAEDFIEPSHYGFKCERLGTEEDIVRLAKLFVEHGFKTDAINPKSELSVVATAKAKGFSDYVTFLQQAR